MIFVLTAAIVIEYMVSNDIKIVENVKKPYTFDVHLLVLIVSV